MKPQIRHGGPFDDQKPGTSGLRKPTQTFRQPGYLEIFLQAIFEADPPGPAATLVVGGDGRHFAREAAVTACRMAFANGFQRVVVGQGGLLSTPAASALIRSREAHGGIILSASHNPGGLEGDFGVKYNTRGGGPASPAVTDAIYQRTRELERWLTRDDIPVDLDAVGRTAFGDVVLQVVDPVTDWLELMQTQFDFDAIRGLVSRPGFRMRFDAMNAVAGPYAHALFERCLGAPDGTVMRGVPLQDFGGIHPDPHPDGLVDLIATTRETQPVDFAAASDGDGDRNMILGPGVVVSPGDSLAILAAHADKIPAFRGRGLRGVARSLPTSRAVDRVARREGFDLYETPTGWKFFTSLLDSGRISLCGEESFGTGSDHIREKDGLWAVLFWLNLMAVTGQGVRGLVDAHWGRYGRDLFQRQDYEGLDLEVATALMDRLMASLEALRGTTAGPFSVREAESFCYTDPVDGSRALDQGVSITLDPDARITLRLSGTGTDGATLRVYLESFIPSFDLGEADAQSILDTLSEAANRLAHIPQQLGRQRPTSVT